MASKSILQTVYPDAVPFEQLVGDDEEYDRQALALVHRLSKDIPKPLTSANTLSALPPSSDTIVFLYLLNHHIDSALPSSKALPRQLPPNLLPEGRFWPLITSCLLEFDPVQARYVGALLVKLVRIVAQGAEQTSNHVPAIQLLQQFILRLDPTSSTLTTTHYHFVRLCVLARAFTDATHLLSLPTYSIAGDIEKASAGRTYKYLCSQSVSTSILLSPITGLSGKVTSKMYLEFSLLAAMCHMGLRDYARAMFFLEAVLISATIQSAVSAIQVDAYKKWLLLGLLLNGETPVLPKGVSPACVRTLKAMAKPYECVAEAFEKADATKFGGEIQEAQQFWAEDCNNGLVLEVFHAYRKFAVMKLGKTFAALSVAEVARRTSPDPADLSETSRYLLTLIQQGELGATLSLPAANAVPILRFTAAPSTKRTEAQVSQELVMKQNEMQTLLKHIAENDHKLEVNKDYIDYLRKLKKAKEQGEKDGVKNNMDMDEEMMADL